MRRAFILLVTLTLFVPSFITRAAPPTIEGCQILPTDNPWNTDISGATVHPNSANIISYINSTGGTEVHPDFGDTQEYGIPWITVPGTQPKVPVSFYYGDESDPGPYPIPSNAPVEGGGDRHVLVIETASCTLYETYDSTYVGGASQAWEAGSGAIWNLNSNALRPDTWTSADAAGLPILPGLARCDEAMSGEITHALRFTVRRTGGPAYIYPATHAAPTASNPSHPNVPLMGMRFRLKSDYNTTGFGPQALAIAEALKTYGMILADNGSNWYISGERDRNECWDDDDLNALKDIPGTAFEVIVSPPPATVVVPAPTLYQPADGAGVTNTQPVLGWNTVTSATSYEFQIGRTDPPTTPSIIIDSTDYTQYIPEDPLLAGFTYFWRVRANAPGSVTTDWSEVRAVTIAQQAGAAPNRNFYTSPPTLTWNRVSGASQYHIQLADNSGFNSPIIDTNLNALSINAPPGLTTGVYYWRVQAQSATGAWSLWSPAESFIFDSGS